MSWMARCKVVEVGVGTGDDGEPHGPFVLLQPASLEDLRMLGAALYEDVFIEPGSTPTKGSTHE